MLAGDLNCISKSPCHRKSRLCNAQINRNGPVFPSSFLTFDRWWTGLDLAFTSIESLNFPETSPQLSELSLRLANAPVFSNPLNLLKLGQKLTHWFIGPIDSLAGSGWCYCWLMFVDVCCELLCLGFGFLVFWKFMQVWSAIFFKATWPPGRCHPFWTLHGKPKKQNMVTSWITRSVFSQFGSNSNNANAW